jgi:uncharacterized protein YyaL (SSP411 family)
MRLRSVLILALLGGLACNGQEHPKEEAPVTRKPNRLAGEKSPYLLQHASNPVDWYPWGEEALEKARSEGKPIFLSIGYSSCHWCHVMEHECFDDEEVAAALNEHFVAIKVDREERPDLDEVYMNAVQLMRQQGGWPLSVWLTPDGKPFAGGTYFPKPVFLDLLRKIATAWSSEEQRARIVQSGERLTELVQEAYDMEEPGPVGAETLDTARTMSELSFDSVHGGFAGSPDRAPKFPSPSSLEMLLRWALRHGDKEALGMVDKTLAAMARGGIHDHIGGGFHRYSVTRDWLLPHFEKMLYDNAQLIGLYAWAHLVTGNERYARVARGIGRWVRREMTHEHGGFGSAQDADDPGGPEGEGGFYVWDPAQVRELLDEDEARVFLAGYAVTQEGNWEERPGKSILTAGPLPESKEELALLDRALGKLYEAREQRPKPMTDDKVLTSWNGLMISGLCRAYQVLGDREFLDLALGAGKFVRESLVTAEGRLLRRWAGGEAAHDAVLADYAYVVAAFLDLYESTFERSWLEEALRLNALAIELFYDEKEGGFFFTADDGEKLIARGKSGYDQARPSGNGVMAMNLLRVGKLTGDVKAHERARETLEYFGNRLAQYALGFGAILNAIDFMEKDTREVFIAGPRDDEATRALIEAIWRDPDPNRVIALVEPGIEELLPPAAGREMVDGQPAAYICRNHTCEAPLLDPEVQGLTAQEALKRLR